jgi:spoIIIJ-associated protein
MKETSWEYSGRTVDEAIQRALEELGLEREDIHVEVLEESQKGFLGIGGKGARVRVELIGEWEVVKKEEPAEGVGFEEDHHPDEEPQPGANTVKPMKMTERIVNGIGVEALVEARERDDSVLVDVWGEDVAVLIGKGGNTLDALQYLVNVACRRTGEVDKRIIVDVEGYRKRRKSRIEKLATQMAGKALSTGKCVDLEPMNPSERKTVHMILRDYSGVRTESEGEGRDRRVVIHPNN